jgi:hypothetical protein
MARLYKLRKPAIFAEVMRDQKAKRMMLNIAAGYERLAEHTASLATNRLPPGDQIERLDQDTAVGLPQETPRRLAGAKFHA